ncbi:hypothetical protein BD779DRAFT_841387 [Infundibulicybe gibba]|nr:hypothetical protein BD779DRAFT_841387 [Infundibulicybe gibba]
MHRHRQVLPIVLHSQTRGAATAANAKPRTWDVPSPAATTPLRTSKWSLPSASATPGSARREQLPLASGSGGTHQKGFTTPDPSGSREEWSIFARTTPQGLTSSLHAPRSNKWAPPATVSIPTTNTSTSHPPKPQRIAQSPSSNSLNRWARNPAQTLSQNHRYMEPSATRNQNHSVEQYPTGKQFNSRFPDNTPPQVNLSQTSDLLPRKYPGRSNPGIQTPGTSYDNVREGRQNRDAFKGRGSLISKIREGIAIPHPKGHATPKKESVKVKRARPKTKKTALVDVFIPTTVSVGMLARLLNVRLGM